MTTDAPRTDDQFRDATKMVSDTPRTDAVTLVKCYCPRCIVGVHDDIQLAAQYRKNAEWRERAEKAEAEVERLKALLSLEQEGHEGTKKLCAKILDSTRGTPSMAWHKANKKVLLK